MEDEDITYRWIIDYKSSTDEDMNGSAYAFTYYDIESALADAQAFREHYSQWYPSYATKEIIIEQITRKQVLKYV